MKTATPEQKAATASEIAALRVRRETLTKAEYRRLASLEAARDLAEIIDDFDRTKNVVAVAASLIGILTAARLMALERDAELSARIARLESGTGDKPRHRVPAGRRER